MRGAKAPSASGGASYVRQYPMRLYLLVWSHRGPRKYPRRFDGSQSVYRMAKSRWAVENHGFNDGKNR